jgi:L-alanine-DL-glutamate epimerase-like enolase superfamily enzyme
LDPRPSTIVGLTTRRLDVAMKKPFGISGGAQHVAANVLVELETRGGTVGWGEGAPFPAFNGETQARTLTACERAAPLLEGVDLDDDAAIAERVRDACHDSPSARCAIETAVFDARARLRGVPLHVLLGGAESQVVSDITITTGTVEEAAREARTFAEFDTLKVKVGAGSVDEDIARIRAIRAARPDARILVDANGGFSADVALRFAAGVAAERIDLFEQPVAGGDWDGLVEIRKKTGLTIAIDESVTAAEDATRAHRLGAADAVNVKIMKSGIFEALAIAERARACGLGRMIGGMVETRLAMGTSACIAAGIGGFSFIDLDTPLFLAEDPFSGGYVQAGAVLDLRPIDVGHGLVPRSRRSR